MSLDFLRWLAYEGELSTFVQEDPFHFGERANGLHLRLHDVFLQLIAFHGQHEAGSDVDLNAFETLSFAALLRGALDLLWAKVRPPEVPWYHNTRLWDFLQDPKVTEKRREFVNIVVDIHPTEISRVSEYPNDFEGFRIIYRPALPMDTQFACNDGIENIDTPETGTICAFLQDPASGDDFALISGHVAVKQGNRITEERVQSRHLGRVETLEFPTATGICNMHAAPGACAVDAALVRLNPSTAHAPRPAMREVLISGVDEGDLIEFHGAGTRRLRQVRVNAATIWKKADFRGTGTLVCYGDLFEIRSRRKQYTNSAISRGGDSGAALGRNVGNYEWFGMLVGGSGGSSYCCYAEHVMNWATAKFPSIGLK